jgi:Zn-dependent protease
MFLTRQGSIRLFGFAGIDLYLHWSWFVIAIFEIQARSGRYSSIVWNILEYLALFMIVLLHEFGHAMACRSVGGTADRIMLWPLGGVAYVNPPQRPGATLWSIAAGPLVNVALLPVLFGAYLFARSNGWVHSMPDVYIFVRSVFTVDIVLLVFNILPIYPLDGGQLLRSLLWFVHRPRPQPDGRHAAQFRGDRRLHCAGRVDAFPLVRSHRSLHADELLERPAACARTLAPGQAAAQAGLRLPELPHRAAAGRLLALRPVQPAV